MKIHYESRNATDVTDLVHHVPSDDQILGTPVQASTWLRAPAPARFVRKQSKVENKGHCGTLPQSSEQPPADCVSIIPISVEIDADQWTFTNDRISTIQMHTLSTQSKYYIAHRQYVAEQLTKTETRLANEADSYNELWDGFLRELSF